MWEEMSLTQRQRVIAALVQMLLRYLAQAQEGEDDAGRQQSAA
jgi:predicted Fe-S protein YdhL (DUF1289 family)